MQLKRKNILNRNEASEWQMGFLGNMPMNGKKHPCEVGKDMK